MGIVRVARWGWLAVPTTLIAACGTVLDIDGPLENAADAGALEDAQRAPDGAAVDATGAVDAVSPADTQAPTDATLDAVVQPDAQAPDDGGDGTTCTGGGGVCVANAPTGWIGPFVLYAGTTSAPVPACTGPFSETLFTANAELPPAGTPSSCGPCSCGAVSGATCGSATVMAPASLGACDDPCAFIGPSTGDCTNFGDIKLCGGTQTPANTMLVEPATSTNGSCTPLPVIPQRSTISWGTAAVACRATDVPTGCADETTCLPNAAAPFGSAACIYRVGDVPCPALATLPYTKRQVFYGGYDDQRDCSACTCGNPTGVRCTTKATSYTGPDCADTAAAPRTAPVCATLFNGGSVSVKVDPATGGSCLSGGGSAGGTLTPTLPVTVCCAP